MKDLKVMNSFGFIKDPNRVPDFKRMFYFSLLKFVEKSKFNFCALLGARQVGKTIALKQILATVKEKVAVAFYDFKIIDCDEADDVVCSILNDIESQKIQLLLLDEITYLNNYDNFLAQLKEVIDCEELNTKIILTGSSCAMIARSCRRVIANNIIYINAPFLTFYEYLVKNGKLEQYSVCNFSLNSMHKLMEDKSVASITKDDFFDYVCNAYKFARFVSIRDYLQHCVDENITSRTNRSWVSDEAVAVDVDVAIGLLYSSLYSLHRNPGWVKFKNNPKEFTYEFFRVKKVIDIKNIEFKKHVVNTYLYEKVDSLNRIPWKVLKNALYFLFDAGLITFQFQNVDVSISSVLNWFSGKSKELFNDVVINNIADFFKYVNIIIISPIPYVAIIQDLCDVLQNNEYNVRVEDILTADQFGSFLETFIKGSYSLVNRNQCINEFRKDMVEIQKTAEVDICDNTHHLLIEIGKRDKHLKDTWFDYAEVNYLNVLIGDLQYGVDSISSERTFRCQRIPYPQASLWLDCILFMQLQNVPL